MVIRRSNLYYYNGSIVIGIVATVSGCDEDSVITSLWHRRLGYAIGVVSRYMQCFKNRIGD